MCHQLMAENAQKYNTTLKNTNKSKYLNINTCWFTRLYYIVIFLGGKFWIIRCKISRNMPLLKISYISRIRVDSVTLSNSHSLNCFCLNGASTFQLKGSSKRWTFRMFPSAKGLASSSARYSPSIVNKSSPRTEATPKLILPKYPGRRPPLPIIIHVCKQR